jgi:UDP-N-acetyl-2-amino-2-deoxyglucuronate dehydrogenase
METAEIGFVIMGLGHIGKRHAEMVLRQNGAHLVAYIDCLSPEKLAFKNAQIPHFYNLPDFLASGLQAQVLNVCTPNGLHAEHALAALNAGMHVVIEKPMALKESDCDALMAKAAEKNLQIFTVMQNRYSPPAAWMKEIWDAKIMGELFLMQLDCYWNRDERYYTPNAWHGKKDLDGGTLFTQFSHFIDMMIWLFGEIKNIDAVFKNFNHAGLTEFDDSGFIRFEFENGGMGLLNFSTAVAQENLCSSMTILAEHGSVKIGGQYMNKVEHCSIKNYSMPKIAETAVGNNYGSYSGSAQNHNLVIENVVRVLNGGENLGSTAAEGKKVVAAINKMYDAKK